MFISHLDNSLVMCLFTSFIHHSTGLSVFFLSFFFFFRFFFGIL